MERYSVCGSSSSRPGNPPLPERAHGKHHTLAEARCTRTPHERLLALTTCPRCGGDGLVVFDSPGEAVEDVPRHHGKCLSGGRVICLSDEVEHQVVYDQLMQPEPGTEADG
ncbi:hypothetical protein ACFYQA_35540 [Streptomyces sp. NPDC005774]|uniref:hypothetical protein n=1 Tax=Streptomyces sp. NPDC005774 TaxID=3364728 RepID=UPI0036976C07